MSNDSATIRKDHSFEIALTEYRDKVYGYCRSEFIVNDTLYYIVKRVKGTIVRGAPSGEGDICEVTDDEIISYNFRGKLDKGIKVTSIFRRNQTDSTWYLDGTWKTNATRKYYAVTGKVGLQEEKDLNASKLFPHLEELNLANDVAFYKERKEVPVIVKVAHPEKIKTEYNDRPQPILNNADVAVAPIKPNIQKADAGPVPVSSNEIIVEIAEVETPVEFHAEKKPVADLPKIDIKNIPATTVALTPAPVLKTIAEAKKPETVTIPEKTNASMATSPVTDLPKSDIKNIPVATVALTPAPVLKTIAEAKKPEAVTIPEKTNASMATSPVTDLPKTDIKNIPATIVSVTPAPVLKTIAETKKPEAVTKPEKTNASMATSHVEEKKNPRPDVPVVRIKPEPIVKTEVKQEKLVVKTQPQSIKQPDAIIKKPDTKAVAVVNNPVPEKKEAVPVITPVTAEVKKPTVDILAKAAIIEGRKTEFTQVVNFKADSLEISLYDNGEIDGDTVSVFMNGEVLLAKQGLKSKAIKKTIYITQANEEFTLVMFAENLGKYPPNTGLLVVHDGEDVYNLRFSSDLQKSSGIVFRKKK